jgi:predicted NAD/FAD-dependent oxidoreductase
MNVLVIGAGIAGLTAARFLQEAGHAIHVVDRGRAPGGRLATRRVLNDDADRPEHSSLAFDHGAQYFTIRDRRFAVEVERWQAARIVQVWHGKLASFDSEGREAVDDEQTRWVGVPAMSAIGRHLARSLDVSCGVRVDGLTRSGKGPEWMARTNTGDERGPFDAVVVAVPAPQALPLVGDSPTLAAKIDRVSMHPCWTALVAFDDRVKTPFDGAFVGSSPLGWIARDRSKPQREFAETWVLHASADWSAAHLDDGADAVGPFLLNAFADLVRAPLPHPVYLGAYRWRHACADPGLAAAALADEAARLVVCGDWCLGNRVEAAFLSGQAAASRAAAWR